MCQFSVPELRNENRPLWPIIAKHIQRLSLFGQNFCKSWPILSMLVNYLKPSLVHVMRTLAKEMPDFCDKIEVGELTPVLRSCPPAREGVCGPPARNRRNIGFILPQKIVAKETKIAHKKEFGVHFPIFQLIYFLFSGGGRNNIFRIFRMWPQYPSLAGQGRNTNDAQDEGCQTFVI